MMLKQADMLYFTHDIIKHRFDLMYYTMQNSNYALETRAFKCHYEDGTSLRLSTHRTNDHRNDYNVII